MSTKIGIFENQNQVIEAIQALEQEGFTKTEIKVLVRNREQSERVESGTNVHADEITELMDTQERNPDHSFGVGFIPVGGMAGGIYTNSTFAGVGSSNANGAPLISAAVYTGDDRMDQALISLGLPMDVVDSCRKAIAGGEFAVVADTGNDKDNGGPNLTRSGIAESVFRRSGAKHVYG